MYRRLSLFEAGCTPENCCIYKRAHKMRNALNKSQRNCGEGVGIYMAESK
jgi:hypothetical protein